MRRATCGFLSGSEVGLEVEAGAFEIAFNAGASAVNPCADILCPGEMGIGNTTAAAAICLALLGGTAEAWCGRGSGVGVGIVNRKAELVAAEVDRHGGLVQDGLDALRIFGGREIAAMAGPILAARILTIPVMLDGFICTAAALSLHHGHRDSLSHCMAGQVSMELAHRRLLDHLGMTPLLDLGLRLGEGTGGVLGAIVVRAALRCHLGMATFSQAGVSSGH